MAIIVPDDLRAFESTLSAEQLEAISATLDAERRTFEDDWVPEGVCPHPFGCYPYDVRLHLPKFGVETKVPLMGVLSSLGMPLAFDASRADFSGTHGPKGAADRLYVTSLIHQANVAIDERGIEAAAGTAAHEGCSGPGPYETHTLKVDRPFFFTIRDMDTGAILFMGRVVVCGPERDAGGCLQPHDRAGRSGRSNTPAGAPPTPARPPTQRPDERRQASIVRRTGA